MSRSDGDRASGGRTAPRALRPTRLARALRTPRRLRRLGLLGLLLAAAVATAPSSALALSQRGHSLGFTFGSIGTALGQFAKGVGPTGVAVNQASGDVYVVDSGNQRVERFSAEGAPISAWGFGVSDGKAEY